MLPILQQLLWAQLLLLRQSVVLAQVSGRYIRIFQNSPQFLHLAQILVFNSETGPNIITPQTKVTASSVVWGGDATKIVNNKGHELNNFCHTSGNEAPWIEVDLGSTQNIYKIVIWNRQDCCKERISGTYIYIQNWPGSTISWTGPFEGGHNSYTFYTAFGRAGLKYNDYPAWVRELPKAQTTATGECGIAQRVWQKLGGKELDGKPVVSSNSNTQSFANTWINCCMSSSPGRRNSIGLDCDANGKITQMSVQI
jgi:hypothetical protein